MTTTQRAAKVLVFGCWDRGCGYPRSDALLEAMRRRGVVVHECHFTMPYRGPEKRRLLRRPHLWPGYLLSKLRVRRGAARMLRRAIAEFRPDIVLVPYPGYFTVHWARAVWKGPLVLDLFLSAYDTAIIDRHYFPPGSLMARFMLRLDRRACAAADRVLVDTPNNVEFVAGMVPDGADSVRWVPVSDPHEPNPPAPYAPPAAGQRMEVLFFGTGVPLHGLFHLIEAMHTCERVRLTLFGGSFEDRCRARLVPPQRLRRLDEFAPEREIRRHLGSTHLVAGVFGTSPKTSRVVPFKVMLALATGRPVITADTPAIRTFLRSDEFIAVPPGDAAALSATLQGLVDQPGRLAQVAEAGHRAYQRCFSLEVVGQRLLDVFAELGVAHAPAAQQLPVAALSASSTPESLGSA
ncbi:MAG: glycosyltransferase [Planctomycetes bacterium]|nr:glycosyltransferase [Planctomycetota bacterium]MCB9868483.1 glycosyltransferase [Planctomycetota bacterium]